MTLIVETADAVDGPDTQYGLIPGQIFSGTIADGDFFSEDGGDRINIDTTAAGTRYIVAIEAVQLGPDGFAAYEYIGGIFNQEKLSGDNDYIIFSIPYTDGVTDNAIAVYPDNNTDTFAYTVRLIRDTVGVGDQFGAQPALTISTGQVWADRFEQSADSDSLVFDAVDGQTYTFVYQTSDGMPAAAFENLSVRTPDGQGDLVEDRQVFADGTIVATFTATQTGTHYVTANINDGFTSFPDWRARDYTISMIEEASADRDTSLAMSDGTLLSGIEFRGDTDWFSVDVLRDTAYRVTVTGEDGLSDDNLAITWHRAPPGPYIEVLGNTDTDDTVSAVDVFSYAAGTIFFEVSTLDGMETGTYRVTLDLLNQVLNGTAQDDLLEGGPGGDTISGLAGNDTLRGEDGDDSLNGGEGRDTLAGGDGADTISGGDTDTDLRDVIYAGDGDDSVDGGYGNDELRGDAGNDTLNGGFGADTVIGGADDDVLTGGALGDLLFGGDGMDFVNGGFGFDRVNGGAGADRFFHLGVSDHGSDWIQDYSAADGDVLVWGGGAAEASDFLVQRANTPAAGSDTVQEVFITHIPSQLLVWALVDGDAQTSLTVAAAGQSFDLLG